MEEKYKNDPNAADDDEDSSSDEEEDEDGFLATEDLDAQISATLQAIRSKDPRVYDGATTFYKADDNADGATKEKKEKPVYLQDYHREKILAGDVGASDNEDEPAPQTYSQEQDALRRATVNEFKAAIKDDDSESDSDSGFLKPKNKKKPDTKATNGVHPSRAAAVKLADLDVKTADKDPETYLSNFMAARAWVEESGTGWKAFESDDDEEADDRADEFEQAYNMRFENPDKSNEVLKSYSRDLANSKSVRRDEKTSRKRKRDAEKEQKEEEKRARKEEKARLRNLKLEEAEQKLKKIKQAAGASGKEVSDKEWMKFLDEAWENDQWEEEMQKRFGDDYYAVDEAANSDDESSNNKKKRKTPKKPTWDDDIDINDIVPDFEDEAAIKEKFALTDDEAAAEGADAASDMDIDDDDEEGGESSTRKRKSADHKKDRLAKQRQSRKERSQLEALVDSKLQLSTHSLLDSDTPFRYRETSPQSFGMTARDILLAPSDQVLNEFAGLKKLATFRDVEKKRKDKKRLNKKARLREWRRGAFGREFETTGPTWGFEGKDGENAAAIAADSQMHESRRKMFTSGEEEGNVIEPEGEKKNKKKKRKRSKKEKVEVDAEAE